VLSALIAKAQSNKLIHCVKITPKAPEITHLLFVDDSLMFCRATEAETSHMRDIINNYQAASGQLVNFNKSELICSKRVTQTTKTAIQQILPIPFTDQFAKYLGQPTHIGRSKVQTFNYIQDKVWKKLKGWKEKHLSFVGRGILIKVVAQAIPTYPMSVFLLPKRLCNQIEGMISRFWWGSNVDKRNIYWVSWKKTCKQKKLGGMGLRDLYSFNIALLAKQGWRIMTGPTSLMASILKAKYFPNTYFLQAKQGHKSSCIWQCIHKASWTLNICEDNWIYQQIGSKTWSPKPVNTNLKKVSDLIDPQTKTWKPNIIQQTFYPYEAAQISQIPLNNTMEEDILRWQGTKDGNYSARSGYNAIMEWSNNNNAQAQQSSYSGDSHNSNKLWSLSNPPK
jgi:hypothetical protein